MFLYNSAYWRAVVNLLLPCYYFPPLPNYRSRNIKPVKLPVKVITELCSYAFNGMSTKDSF